MLKGTQVYSAPFGAAVAGSLLDFRDYFDDLDCTGGRLNGSLDDDTDPWEDCDLEPLFVALNRKHAMFE